MKKHFTVLVLSLICYASFAQDQIILKSAEELKGKVTEIKIDRIVYKDADNLEGPTIELRKEDVFMIIYENGSVFKIPEEQTNSSETKTSAEVATERKIWNPKDYPHIVSFFVNGPELRFSPEIEELSGRTGTESIGVGIGVSYEYQASTSNFSIRISPTFNQYETRFGAGNSWVDRDVWNQANGQKLSDGSIRSEFTNDSYTAENLVGGVGFIEYASDPSGQPTNSWGFTLPISPRWIVKNAQYGQMHIGFEVRVGTIFKASRDQIEDVFNPANTNYRYSSVSASGGLIIGGNVIPVSMFNVGVESGVGYEYLRQQHTTVQNGFNSTYTSKSIYQNHLLTFFVRFSIGARLKGRTSVN